MNALLDAPPNGARLIGGFDGYAIDSDAVVYSTHRKGGGECPWHRIAEGAQAVYLVDRDGVRRERSIASLMASMWPEIAWRRPAAAEAPGGGRTIPGLDERYMIDADGVVWSACRGGTWRALTPSASGTVAIHDGSGQRVQRSWRSLHALAWPELQAGVRTGHGLRAELVADAVQQRLEALHLRAPAPVVAAPALDVDDLLARMDARVQERIAPLVEQLAAVVAVAGSAPVVAAPAPVVAPVASAPVDGYLRHLVDLCCAALDVHAVAEHIGVGPRVVAGWWAGTSPPDRFGRELEQLAAVLLAERHSVDEDDFDELRELRVGVRQREAMSRPAMGGHDGGSATHRAGRA